MSDDKDMDYGDMYYKDEYYESTYYENEYYDDPKFQILFRAQDGFLVMQIIGIFVELIFFFVMIRNWFMKNSVLKSPFFYLTTLKIANDFLVLLYTIIIRCGPEEFDLFSASTEFLFYTFNMECDTLCQSAIAVNRYTALMMPFKHERVSYPISFRFLKSIMENIFHIIPDLVNQSNHLSLGDYPMSFCVDNIWRIRNEIKSSCCAFSHLQFS